MCCAVFYIPFDLSYEIVYAGFPGLNGDSMLKNKKGKIKFKNSE